VSLTTDSLALDPFPVSEGLSKHAFVEVTAETPRPFSSNERHKRDASRERLLPHEPPYALQVVELASIFRV